VFAAVAEAEDLCGRQLGEFLLRERIDEGGAVSSTAAISRSSAARQSSR
jgi:hypothetical protein